MRVLAVYGVLAVSDVRFTLPVGPPAQGVLRRCAAGVCAGALEQRIRRRFAVSDRRLRVLDGAPAQGKDFDRASRGTHYPLCGGGGGVFVITQNSRHYQRGFLAVAPIFDFWCTDVLEQCFGLFTDIHFSRRPSFRPDHGVLYEFRGLRAVADARRDRHLWLDGRALPPAMEPAGEIPVVLVRGHPFAGRAVDPLVGARRVRGHGRPFFLHPLRGAVRFFCPGRADRLCAGHPAQSRFPPVAAFFRDGSFLLFSIVHRRTEPACRPRIKHVRKIPFLRSAKYAGADLLRPGLGQGRVVRAGGTGIPKGFGRRTVGHARAHRVCQKPLRPGQVPGGGLRI